MKLSHVNNVEAFFETVEKCAGKVELVTGEGDRLNLKSKLTQYVALSKVFGDAEIPEMELVVYDAADAKLFLDYMMNA